MSARALSLPFLRRRAEAETASLPDLLARAEQVAQSIRTGDHARRRAGTGDQFWQFRDYQAGDRPRDIDWKRSGHGDRVLIRQREEQRAQTALFWCASDAGMDYRSDSAHATKREAGLTLCLAAALLLKNGGEKIGVLNQNSTNWEQLGNQLFDATAESLPPLNASPPRHAQIILTGDFLAPLPEIETRFAALATNGTRVIIIIQTLDPAELSLPFSGRVIFEDFVNAQQERIDHVASIRAAYRARIDSHLEAVAALCRARQWHYLLHTTDTPERETLADLWQLLSPDATT